MKLKKMFSYEFPRPGLTVDLVILYKDVDDIKILLIKRRNDPYKDYWALPGGYVEQGEDLEQAAKRELEEETGITDVNFRQIGAFGDPKRDPRGWTVTVAFTSYVDKMDAKAGDDAKDAKWFSINELPQLAFDHPLVISTTLNKLGKGYET